MIQNYKGYTAEQQWVWKELFTRQQKNLLSKGTALHNDSTTLLYEIFNAEAIPHLADLSAALLQRTGWQIHIVEGFIPATDFLNLLSEKKFAASTWLRQPEQLDYLEEPDMFHDVFGHVPLLCNTSYVNFFKGISDIALKNINNNKAIELLGRLYWFTIEFGLIKENDQFIF